MLVVLAALCAFAVASGVRLAYWQVARPDLRNEALALTDRPEVTPVVRGDIVDRDGRILATTAYRDRLIAWPNLISSARLPALMDELATLLALEPGERTSFEDILANDDAQYAVLDRELTEEQSQAIRDALAQDRLGGLALESYPVRVYPMAGGAPGTTLASQLLGFVNSEGVGNYGIEQQYDRYLAGQPTDATDAPVAQVGGGTPPAPSTPGSDIKLTIDASLQLQLEKELYAAWVGDGSSRVSGMVMDPDTGEVLAWASVPGYDANQYATVASTDPALFQDPLASMTYEPGSVMKMLTATAVLRNEVLGVNDRVMDRYALRFGTQLIRNADWQSMGRIRFKDAISYSRNVATASIARKLGRSVRRASNVLYRTWSDLGIGRPTQIDVANEASGIAADPRTQPWAPIDLANRSFGQAVAVTPVQLAAAYTPMINGGVRVQPHLLRAVGDELHEPPAGTRVLPRRVARQLRTILEHTTSAVPWYAEGSLIPGYQVGGKTGTAQIWRADKGRYAAKTFNFSFFGFVGGDRPEAVVAIRIHDTVPEVHGRGDLRLRITSYELFRRVARQVIGVLQIRRSSDPRAGLPERGSAADRALQEQAARAQEEREEREARREEREARRQEQRDARGEQAAGDEQQQADDSGNERERRRQERRADRGGR
jgi:cell division protein FtsI (penicillin-binding protein 3)